MMRIWLLQGRTDQFFYERVEQMIRTQGYAPEENREFVTELRAAGMTTAADRLEHHLTSPTW